MPSRPAPNCTCDPDLHHAQTGDYGHTWICGHCAKPRVRFRFGEDPTTLLQELDAAARSLDCSSRGYMETFPCAECLLAAALRIRRDAIADLVVACRAGNVFTPTELLETLLGPVPK